MTITPLENALWENKLKNKITRLLQRGIRNFEEILPLCSGAQPKEVFRIFTELGSISIASSRTSLDYKNKFFFRLPAANPSFFQWWYTLESQESMCFKILDDHDSDTVACIGAPTLAATIASHGKEVTLLDVDKDIVDLFNTVFASGCIAETYDVNDDIPPAHDQRYNCVVIDPPWYHFEFRKFISRAILLSKDGATIYCSIPQRMTRPGIEEERRKLISEIFNCGHEIISIEPNAMKYIVPYFEEEVLRNNNIDAKNYPWRSSDLLIIKVNGKKILDIGSTSKRSIRSFSLSGSSSVFRVFLENKNIQTPFQIEKVEEFSNSISSRDTVRSVNFWTSDKQGFQLNDVPFFTEVLNLWSTGITIENTIESLQDSVTDKESDIIEQLVRRFETETGIWKIGSSSQVRRTAEEIRDANDKITSMWASKSSEREYKSKSDGFRIEFQRDRDRIIWSNGFRKLADKTQLFPLDEDEHLRQRLAHSIEVMQLASTIGAAFGLDKDLIEAGALAHDIGHTPFGHAGEYAIDRMFKKLGFESGFNHYEHGVDVVRFLEGSYQHGVFESHHGLNLTPEVCDCILKHTYCHGGDGPSQEKVWKHTKHSNYLAQGYSHLEGQAVRAADKISYLLSDIEDGIKLGAIQMHDLLGCRLFHRPPIDFRMRHGENLYLKFIEQRGYIIKLLMEDIILESTRRIGKLSSKNDVFKADDYCIFHSSQIHSDMGEIWRKIQVAKLHGDPRVLSANMMASKMVGELLLLLTIFPEHINIQFRTEHERLNCTDYMDYYRKQHRKLTIPDSLVSFLPLDMMIGFKPEKYRNIDVYQLVLAKDFVAGLTDKKLKKLHNDLLG